MSKHYRLYREDVSAFRVCASSRRAASIITAAVSADAQSFSETRSSASQSPHPQPSTKDTVPPLADTRRPLSISDCHVPVSYLVTLRCEQQNQTAGSLGEL